MFRVFQSLPLVPLAVSPLEDFRYLWLRREDVQWRFANHSEFAYAGRIIARELILVRARDKSGTLWRNQPADGYRRARAVNAENLTSRGRRHTLKSRLAAQSERRFTLDTEGETAHFALPWAATRFRPIPRQLILTIRLAKSGYTPDIELVRYRLGSLV